MVRGPEGEGPVGAAGWGHSGGSGMAGCLGTRRRAGWDVRVRMAGLGRILHDPSP